MPPRQRDLRHKGAASRAATNHPVPAVMAVKSKTMDTPGGTVCIVRRAREIGNGEVAMRVCRRNTRLLHLHVHSSFSLLEGALPSRARGAGQGRPHAGAGLADTGNLFGALEFAEKMVESGVQPIIGCQVAVDFGDTGSGPARRGRGGSTTSCSSRRARRATGTSSAWSRPPSWTPRRPSGRTSRSPALPTRRKG